MIIVTSLHRDFLPASWDMYYPTIWDFSTFFGTIGLFTTLMFLFVRVLPMISIFEVRTLVPEAESGCRRTRCGRRHHVRRRRGRRGAVKTTTSHVFGLMAEFDNPTTLVEAARRDARRGLPEDGRVLALSDPRAVRGAGRARQPRAAHVLLGGIAGCLGGFGLCYWVSAIAYPLNVGGRPYNSWPAFIPVTFEVTILFASFAAVLELDHAERTADAVSPGVQRAAVRRNRERKGLLPHDRINRPEVRSQPHARVPEGTGCERDQ